MQKTKMRALAAMSIFVVAISGTSYAYAQTPNPLTDNQLALVLIASLVGVIVSPIVGFASQDTTGTNGVPAPFDVKRYGRALIIGIPAVVTMMLGEITSLHVTATGVQGVIMLFLMAFTNGMTIDYLKARVNNQNANKQAALKAKLNQPPK